MLSGRSDAGAAIADTTCERTALKQCAQRTSGAERSVPTEWAVLRLRRFVGAREHVASPQ